MQPFRSLATLLAVAISAGWAPSLDAQQPRPAQQAPPVRAAEMSGAVGVVLDSINGGVLAGATILLEGTGASARTDNAGAFRFDSISPGTHRLVLRHPLADSIGFEIASAPIEMLPGRYVVVAMAVPSSATLRRILCSPRDTSSEIAMLVGRVTDPETDSAVVGARVSFLYQHLLISGDSGVRRTNRLRETITRDDGMYAICGLPPEVTGTLQGLYDSVATPEVPIRRGDRSVLFRNLTIARVPRGALEGGQPPDAAVAAPGDASPSAEHPPRSGRAVLEGRVVDVDGAAVAGAQVTVVGTVKLTIANEDGTFTLDGLPSGTNEVVARKIGFTPASEIVELTTRVPQRVRLTLNRALAQTLETVTVRAPMAERLRRIGFDDRRRMGLGRFMDAEQIERRQPMHVTDILRSFPGFRIVESESGRTIVPVRSVA
ncbi:MAG: carboxypeptidase regulatory-like domain-containing protein, partial [Sulfuricaulis sp.]|nr:carboxypeptidase regulatory-like domain-containing protein [Sulfuricaulis sp.]